MPAIVITNLRGGRNGVDSPLSLPENQCVEALNVDWSDGPLGRKRGGAIQLNLAGGTAFTAGVAAMFRHVPAGDETASELWAIGSDFIIKRLKAGTTWADVAVDYPPISRPQDTSFATLNGKLFMAYKSAVDRLMVFDPAVNAVRVVGLSAPAPPSVADQGGGAYPAVLRYYRTRVVQLDGTRVVRRSEPTASVAFTPSGGGAAAQITRGTFPNERETDWEIEVSIDDSVFYVLTQLPIATTVYLDTTLQAAYFDLETSEDVGQFNVPAAPKFLATDGNRLLLAGSQTTTGLGSRVWFTPVLGDADHGDDERIPDTDAITNYLDLNEKDGGDITALSMPLQGAIIAFKYRAITKLVPTGDVTAPYIPRKLSDFIGAINHQSVVMAEDAIGNPVVAFLSHKGPHWVGVSGLSHVGRDVEDRWFGFNGQTAVNLDATFIVAHGVYYSDLHQLWWYVAKGAFDSPSERLVLDTRYCVMSDQFGLRGGWAIHDGKSCKCVCSCMFSDSVAVSMSRRLKPYGGYRQPL